MILQHLLPVAFLFAATAVLAAWANRQGDLVWRIARFEVTCGRVE